MNSQELRRLKWCEFNDNLNASNRILPAFHLTAGCRIDTYSCRTLRPHVARAPRAKPLFSERDTDSALNGFVCLTTCLRYAQSTLRVVSISLLAVLGVLSLHASSGFAQRVQFPTPNAPVDPYSVPAVAPPTVMSTPLPATAAPVYSPAAVGPPPAFDPYASGATISAPAPLAAPYTPPPPASAFPPQAAPTFAPPPTVPQWDPAPMITSGEAYWDQYWTKTQRVLSELSAEYTYLFGDHSDPSDLAWDRLELSVSFAFPIFSTAQAPLIVTPGFAWNWIEGPAGIFNGSPDLPPRVYDAYLDFGWNPRINQVIGAELGFRTGVYSDFSFFNSDSLRFMGRGVGSFAVSPYMDVLLGAAYLDRLDVKILPVAGVYYRPNPEWDMYLVFPNPKIRKSLMMIGNSKWYGYAGGEYGGGSWTAQRNFVSEDQFDYNDIRVFGGLEWETQTFIRGHIELGYVFDRELVFRSGNPSNFSLDDTFMVRAGIDF